MSTPYNPTIIHNGKARSISNSRGEPIADNDAKLHAFWDWFGDSQSIDEYGRPVSYFRCQSLTYPIDSNLTERYYTNDRNYAISYYKNERPEHILQFYIKTDSLNKRDEINEVTDFTFYELELSKNGYDAVCDSQMHVFVAVGGDHQFKHAGEFNSDHVPLIIPNDSFWRGRSFIGERGITYTPICGKSGKLFMPGYEYQRAPTQDNPRPTIEHEWREPSITHGHNLMFAKAEAVRLTDKQRPRQTEQLIDMSSPSM